MGNKAYLLAYDTASRLYNYLTLYETDGTSAGTTKLTNISTFSVNNFPAYNFTVLGSLLYFGTTKGLCELNTHTGIYKVIAPPLADDSSLHSTFGIGVLDSSIIFNNVYYNNDADYLWKYTPGADPNVSIREAERQQLSIYPNPTRSAVRISASGMLSTGYAVSDMMGRVVTSNYFPGRNVDGMEIDLHDLPQGIYTLTLRDQQNYLYTSKIVKE